MNYTNNLIRVKRVSDYKITNTDLSGAIDNFNYHLYNKFLDGIGEFVMLYREFYKVDTQL
jgi:hypothetical protein